jgi:hypothetical protein
MKKNFVIIYTDGHRFVTNGDSFREAIQNSELGNSGKEIQIVMTEEAYRKFDRMQNAIELACINRIEVW